jgi:hypothetical protein
MRPRQESPRGSSDIYTTKTNEDQQQPHPRVYYDDDKFQISLGKTAEGHS